MVDAVVGLVVSVQNIHKSNRATVSESLLLWCEVKRETAKKKKQTFSFINNEKHRKATKLSNQSQKATVKTSHALNSVSVAV